MKRTNVITQIIVGALLTLALSSGVASRSSDDYRANLERGDRAIKEGNFHQAIDFYRPIQDCVNIDTALCRGLLYGGNACFIEHRYVEALDFFSIGANNANRLGCRHIYDACINNIGDVYALFGDYERSAHYFSKAYASAMSQENTSLMYVSAVNLVQSYCNIDSVKLAKKYYQVQLRHPTDNSQLNQYRQFMSQGFLSKAEKSNAGAIFYFKKACEIADLHKLGSELETSAMSWIARVYLDDGKAQQSLEYLNKIAVVADTANLPDIMCDNLSMLSRAWQLLGEEDKASKYHIAHMEMTDSLFNQKEFTDARNRLLGYEDYITDEQMGIMKDRIERQWWLLGGIGLTLVLTLVILLIIHRYNQRLRQANKQILRKNMELMESDRESGKLRERLTQFIKTEPLSSIDDDMKVGEDEIVDKNACNISDDQILVLLGDIERVVNDTDIITNPSFSLAELSHLVGSNTKYVSIAINKSFNKNFKTYLGEHRIRIAADRLLSRPNLTAIAIAESVGFRSYPNFVATFRSVTGMTPSEYKKAAQ